MAREPGTYHYTPTGKAVDDQMTIGLVLAKEHPTEHILTVRGANNTFKIPPGALNHEVASRFTFRNPCVINKFLPHMHVRGKDYEVRVLWPDGHSETLLRVPSYRFNWQLSYKLETPLAVPAGTVIESISHFDNSPNNPWNPDPKATVHFGEQSWEEMSMDSSTSASTRL